MLWDTLYLEEIQELTILQDDRYVTTAVLHSLLTSIIHDSEMKTCLSSRDVSFLGHFLQVFKSIQILHGCVLQYLQHSILRVSCVEMCIEKPRVVQCYTACDL